MQKNILHKIVDLQRSPNQERKINISTYKALNYRIKFRFQIEETYNNIGLYSLPQVIPVDSHNGQTNLTMLWITNNNYHQIKFNLTLN